MVNIRKSFTIPRPVAHKSAKYMARIVEKNSLISDSVSPEVFGQEMLSSSFEFLFFTVLCQSDASLKDGG